MLILKLTLQALYVLGARKFGIVDVPPIGCCPYPRSLNPTGGCLDVLNELSVGFNKAVKLLMHRLSSTLKGMKYSVGSSYAVVSGIIRNPAALGIYAHNHNFLVCSIITSLDGIQEEHHWLKTRTRSIIKSACVCNRIVFGYLQVTRRSKLHAVEPENLMANQDAPQMLPTAPNAIVTCSGTCCIQHMQHPSLQE